MARARIKQNYSPYLDSWVKRCFDLLFCTAVILPSAVLLSAALIAVLLFDGLPLMFFQKRTGRNGRSFYMPKIRTLKKETLPDKPSCSLDVDRFTTSTGRFLRTHRIDELPQIFCVLTGRMSLVGPRPELESIANRYNSKHLKRLLARPGITGLWQIKGSRNKPIHKDIKYDLYYLRKASLSLDIKILLKTIVFVLKTEKKQMKTLAYITGTYPCRSELSIQREISALISEGFEIIVFAASGKNINSNTHDSVKTYYRPAFFSITSLETVFYTFAKRPLWILVFFNLLTKLLFSSPIEALKSIKNIHTIFFFAGLAQKLEIDHIHACFFSWPAVLGLHISALSKKTFSISAHARDIFVEKGAWKLKTKHSEFVTCCCKQGYDHLKKLFKSKYHHKLVLNYHGVDTKNNFCKDIIKTPPASVELIIACGRLVPKKGFEYLVDAFAKLAAKRPNAFLIIAGDGPQKKHLQYLIGKYSIKHQTLLTGWLEQNSLQKLIANAKALIVPSVIEIDGDRDGIPNVILEAFNSATPVIASPLPGISEAVIHQHTGLLTNPQNTDQLAQTIERLLTDRILADSLARNAKKFAIEKFDVEKNCRKLATLFEEAGQ